MMIVTIPIKGVYLWSFRKGARLFLPLDAANKVVLGEPPLSPLVEPPIVDIIVVALGEDPQLAALSPTNT